ncbi:hypothetical protein NC652_017140 [Populus alba x Populus x berolinensis]|nr:hypothetical protein NC652_017140 [Populus alba x Populus x berolinensis]
MMSLSALIHAPSPCFLSTTHRSTSSPDPTTVRSSSMAASARIAVVGDVHDDWNLEEDTKALQLLQVTLVMRMWNSSKALRILIYLNLGEEHVAYKRLDFPTLKLSVVGGRPFSCGGEQIFRRSLLSARYGIQDMDGSADRIYNAALGTPEDHMVILLAHNGPTGLGSNLNDICGKDWVFGGGDHGDPDLAQAISHLKETTKISIPLVVFGHMHKELAYGNGLRKMIVVGADKTIYLNGAIVPRVRRLVAEQGTDNTNFMNNETSVFSPGSRGTMRAFTLVEILEGRVDKIAETWVSVIEDETAIEEEHVLFQRGN